MNELIQYTSWFCKAMYVNKIYVIHSEWSELENIKK